MTMGKCWLRFNQAGLDLVGSTNFVHYAKTGIGAAPLDALFRSAAQLALDQAR